MMGAVHLLPGTTQSLVAAKGSYDVEAMAAMTLREFDGWLALEICRYNNSIHSSLGCTPVAKWDALAGEMSGDIPFDMEAFWISFLPSEQRQVWQDGVHLFDLRYWSDALAAHVGRRDGKVVVRYDPRDISVVWVERDSGRYVEARYRNLKIPPVSLWEYHEAMQKTLAVPGLSGLRCLRPCAQTLAQGVGVRLPGLWCPASSNARQAEGRSSFQEACRSCPESAKLPAYGRETSAGDCGIRTKPARCPCVAPCGGRWTQHL